MWSTLRSIISLALLLTAVVSGAQDKDTSAAKAPELQPGRQLRLDLEVSKPVVNALVGRQYSYEALASWYYKKEVYAVVEGGFGGASLDYEDLSYSSSNTFFRIGVDKALIKRLVRTDWDLLFIGLRYGMALINRKEATFVTTNALWGPTSGTIPGRHFSGHWAEVTGGVRVEVLPGWIAGWNIRGRFLLNPKSFEELPPSYIAGYGKGDKTTTFDFNLYLCYALRWGGNGR